MKTFIVFIIFVVGLGLTSCSPQDVHIRVKRDSATPEQQKTIDEWLQKFGSKYANKDEEKKGLEKLLIAIAKIEAHNKLYDEGKKTYKLRLGEHSDMDFADFKKNMGGNELPDGYDDDSEDDVDDTDDDAQRRKRQGHDKTEGDKAHHKHHRHHRRRKHHTKHKFSHEFSYPEFSSSPDAIDWSEKGLVGPVRQQRHCGGCYAFSAAGVMESLWRKNGIQKQASPQQIIDCSHVGRDNGCHGGFTPDTMKYILANGLTDESQYPFIGKEEQKCNYNKDMNVLSIKKVYHVPTRFNETWMKEIVGNVGPISVGICIDETIHHFHDGVYDPESCCKKVDHAALITGYGTDPKYGDYWIFKNSWGHHFGVDGFMKIARGKNVCTIGLYALYAE